MQEALAKLRNKLFRKTLTRHIVLAVGLTWALLINQLPSIPRQLDSGSVAKCAIVA